MSEPIQHGVEHENDHGGHEHHVTPPIVYLVIFGCLLTLTGLTVGASYIEMGVFNPIVAIAIGVVKATLVVLFFMGVKYSTKLTKLTVGAGLFTFMVLIGMTLADYFTRAWGRW
ncbi:MAG: cytochrome C oxidase subunit IV family protein [Terracidiphilus sp.]|jgi:cytochrome c oxidase subunit 4